MDRELKILLISPRGFWAGVDEGIEVVKKALLKHGSPHLISEVKRNCNVSIEEIALTKEDVTFKLPKSLN